MNYEKQPRVAIVSTLLPETNYSRYLCSSLSKKESLSFFVYADKKIENSSIKDCGNVKLVWEKNLKFIFQIARQAIRDRLEAIHLQHEINMFGGTATALAFPWLLLFLKILGVKTIVTLHAVVSLGDINRNFIKAFRGETLISPWMLKFFFIYLNRSIGLFSDRVIVHTNMLKKALREDYGVVSAKIKVLPHGVPEIKNLEKRERKPFFLFFGYILKRKGLEKLIEGYADFVKKRPGGEEFKLILAGGTIPGQEFARKEIEKIIKEKGVSRNIELTGFIENEKIRELFEEAFAIVMPAVISISASGPLAQALAYRKCVLASKIGHFEEEIEDGKDGILVDNDSWEKALSRIVEDPSLIGRIESEAEKKARERSWEAVAEKHFQIYQEIL